MRARHSHTWCVMDEYHYLHTSICDSEIRVLVYSYIPLTYEYVSLLSRSRPSCMLPKTPRKLHYIQVIHVNALSNLTCWCSYKNIRTLSFGVQNGLLSLNCTCALRHTLRKKTLQLCKPHALSPASCI